MRRTVAVMFGGRSLEHDVSVVSGLQILHAIDPDRFAPMPIYIDQSLRWWVGDDLWHNESFKGGGPDRSRATEVALSPGFGTSTLVPVGSPGGAGFSRPAIRVDVFIPVLHGTYGEDGSISASTSYSNTLRIPPIISSAVDAVVTPALDPRLQGLTITGQPNDASTFAGYSRSQSRPRSSTPRSQESHGTIGTPAFAATSFVMRLFIPTADASTPQPT